MAQEIAAVAAQAAPRPGRDVGAAAQPQLVAGPRRARSWSTTTTWSPPHGQPAAAARRVTSRRPATSACTWCSRAVRAACRGRMFEPLIQRLNDLSTPGFMFSGDRMEGGSGQRRRDQRLPVGRALYVPRGGGASQVQTARLRAHDRPPRHSRAADGAARAGSGAVTPWRPSVLLTSSDGSKQVGPSRQGADMSGNYVNLDQVGVLTQTGQQYEGNAEENLASAKNTWSKMEGVQAGLRAPRAPPSRASPPPSPATTPSWPCRSPSRPSAPCSPSATPSSATRRPSRARPLPAAARSRSPAR